MGLSKVEWEMLLNLNEKMIKLLNYPQKNAKKLDAILKHLGIEVE